MTGDIQLRLVEEQDRAIFFEHQKDPEANDMAAFTAKEGRDRASFMTHWANILKDPSIQGRTIVFNGNVAGNILSFIAPWSGHREVSYWLGRKFWGKGITTCALALFVKEFPTRPLHARAAADNLASIRVLEKCGFKLIGHDHAFAPAREAPIDEVLFVLETVCVT